MRGGFADGVRPICSVDAVALNAQAHPACAERIVRSRRDYGGRAVVSGIHQAGDDVEFTFGRRRRGRSYGDVVSLRDLSIHDDGELSLRDGNENSFGPGATLFGIERSGR